MTLNEEIGVILKQHKEGEEFFNALDFMIKGDRSILEDFLSFFMNDAGKKLTQAFSLIRGVVGNSTQSSRELGFNAVERCKYCGKPSTHEGGLCDNCYNVRHY